MPDRYDEIAREWLQALTPIPLAYWSTEERVASLAALLRSTAMERDMKPITETTRRLIEQEFAERVARYVMERAAQKAESAFDFEYEADQVADAYNQGKEQGGEEIAAIIRSLDPATLAREAMEKKT